MIRARDAGYVSHMPKVAGLWWDWALSWNELRKPVDIADADAWEGDDDDQTVGFDIADKNLPSSSS